MKHMHSHTLARSLAGANAIVTKDKTGDAAETLLQRVQAYRTDRFGKQYSTSIEGFRFQEIRRAGEYLAAKKSPKKSRFD
ncbi:MAG: hypothetical protein JF606_14795 [Burkholderiales bacterium]|nr:hypothetical protein [Burkholderiales bacterium]